MKHKRLYIKILFTLVIAFALFFSESMAQDVAKLKVGRFWTPAANIGDQNIQRGIATSGWFPGDFDVGANNGKRYAVLGCTNWTGPDGTVYETATCCPASQLNPTGTVVTPLNSWVRYALPKNEIKGVDARELSYGVENPSMMIGTCDQVIENTYEYGLGVQAERKIFAWSQENHDDYYVTDVTYTNISSQTLENLYIYHSYSPVYDGMRSYGGNPGYSASGDHRWSWCHYYGSRPGDSLRIYYNYHADDPDVSGDNMGQPVPNQGGRLMRGDAGFMAFLHVSKEPFTDAAMDEDDFLQPVTSYMGQKTKIGHQGGQGVFGYEIDHPRANGYDMFAGAWADKFPAEGTFPGTHHQKSTDEVGDPDYTAQGNHIKDGNFYIFGLFAAGPYNMEPGEKIRIVFVQGVAGLSIEKSIELGEQWLDNTIEYPEGIPDPDKGFLPQQFAFPPDMTDRDHKKDLWISTVIDSVHKTASRAKWNFDHNWQVPAAPPPPDLTISPFGGYVEVKWSCPEAEALDNFAGYRVMRRISNLDTVFFELIHETGPNDKADEHIYEDRDVKLGAAYYYYVQSAVTVDENDMNALPEVRGTKLYSGRAFTATQLSVKPPRAAAADMEGIRVVPNPYNINDPKVIAMGWVDYRGINFMNLPAFCTIRVFTEDGDLVKTINHDDPYKTGSEYWNMLTESEQVINSGMYIAVFEDDAGNIVYRKFAVVR
jgi:hypothetical protein